MPATYADRLQGLTTSVAVKPPCRVATVANIALSGLATVDGVALAERDRVLVKDQSDATLNGIWTALSGAWRRALDFNGSRDAVGGTQTMVIEGSIGANTYWRVAGEGPLDIGIDDIEWEPALISDSSTAAFIQAGTGSVTRTAQAKLREFVSVEDFGAVGDGVTDDTAAFVAAFAAHDAVRALGEYVVSQFTLTDNKTFDTNGASTALRQKSGQPSATPIIQVTGSNVTIGSFTAYGNIATDTGEFSHVIRIYNVAASLENISVGNIRGIDIRGDVLYIGAGSGFTTRGVRFGFITGTNIYRNVVSIVGACQVVGDGAISDGATGYSTLDIEPDFDPSTDIVVGLIRGAVFQCAPPNAADAASNIRIDALDMDPSYGPNSTPNYASHNVSTAVRMRNIKGIRLGQLRVNGYSGLAVNYDYNPGEVRGVVSIDELLATNIGPTEPTVKGLIQAGGMDYLSIGYVKGTAAQAAQAVAVGSSDPANPTVIQINGGVWDEAIVRYASRGSVIKGVKVPTPANSTTVIFQCTDTVFIGCDITANTLISSSSGCALINCKTTCTTYIGSSVTNLTRINTAFGAGAVRYAEQPVTVATLPTAAAAGTGARCMVSDANATTFNSVVAGSGANTVPVFSDGTNWRIG